MDDRLHSEREIKSLLPFAVVSEIPEVVSPLDERSAQRKLVLGWATAGFVVFTILAGSAFSFLQR
jgi:hypothetical protein